MIEERFHEDESRGHTYMDFAEARKKSHEMQQRIEWLLELQEHLGQLSNEPEQKDACFNFAEQEGRRQCQLTDNQIQQILADDEMSQLVRQLGFTKRAFKHHELKGNTPDVDNEWEQFAASHAGELDALDSEPPVKSVMIKHIFSHHKMAASFIGVLFVSGIAFAAIWSLTPSPSPKGKGSEYTQVSDTVKNDPIPLSTGSEAGSETVGDAPYVFNNVQLDSMLTTIAAAHGVEVEFKSDAARELRFHFVWKREDSLARVVEKLNTFEAVNIGMEDKKLVVR